MNPQTNYVTDTDTELKMPGMYAVIIHNDHVTTMEFVVEILIDIFNKPPNEAAALMMDVHESGRGIAGIYVFDIAATKRTRASQRAAEKGFPLKLTLKEVLP